MPGACPVPAHVIQVPIMCMHHLMSKGITWACPYNVNSWCLYANETYACAALDGAPKGSNYQELLEYRDLEQRYWIAMMSPQHRSLTKALKLHGRMSMAKKELIENFGQQNLYVCAFYRTYQLLDLNNPANKADKDIDMLLTSEVISIKGDDS